MRRWILGKWYARLRRIDIDILWPICRTKATDIDHARAAFALHALHDRAWLFLGEEKAIELIGRLI
jgi:hypothetical protein